MRLEELTLSSFRNYTMLEFAPGPGLNVLVGANAQGKSNLLEAVAMLGTGKSFRTSREGELIAHGGPLAAVAGTARIHAGSIRLACTIARNAAGATRKQYTVNGEGVRYASFLGSIKVVTFVPADLSLVGGGPALRRAMMNEALAIADPAYYRRLVRYRKTLLQKNALLRGSSEPDRDLLATYDQALVENGTALMLARGHYLTTLGEVAASIHRRWVKDEHLELRYAPNVPIETPTQDAIAQAFVERLRAERGAELARRVSLAGPHRDDVRFMLDGESLAALGSQGQQRTAVLALKVAEYAVLRDRTGEAPILLLDDVLSELDPTRAEAFVAALSDVEQAFITATQRPAALGGDAAVWRVAAATVARC